jgi:hypothetical protein
MTPQKMVHNLTETGTPFAYKVVDFSKLTKGLKHDLQHLEDARMTGQEPAEPALRQLTPGKPISTGLLSGEQDIPNRDKRYLEKDDTEFEDEE